MDRPRSRDVDRGRRSASRGASRQGFVAGTQGPSWGLGAAVALSPFTVVLARALARCGAFKGDPTIATIVVDDRRAAAASSSSSRSASRCSRRCSTRKGNFAPALAAERLLTADIWGLGCLGGGTRCGVAINSALLATIVGVCSTLLGLVLALVVQRGGQRYAGVLRVMSILPIITPPFVIALALVVLFGRTGLVTDLARASSASRARAGSTACPA